MNILKIKNVLKLKNYFYSYFKLKNLKEDKIDISDLYNFASTKKFNSLYKKIISETIKSSKLNPNRVCVQAQPTFRKYTKNSHGTSFHNDYLYGHGKKTNTVWIPLYGLKKENSVYFLKKKFRRQVSDKLLLSMYSKEFELKLIQNSEIPDLKNDEIITFNSKIIHGSPKNLSNVTRYSLDFRISEYNDKSSNKKMHHYLFFENNKWKQKNIFKGKRFLKYICGGKNKDTIAQHLIIESVSKYYNINIVAQEAEFERYGYEILKKNMIGKLGKKNYNSIIISSSTILKPKILSQIINSKIQIYSALEGKFLN